MFKWFQSCWCLIFISDCWLIPPLWVIQLWVSLLAFPATNWPSWDSERLLDPPINPISEHVSLPPGLLRSGPGWVRTCHLLGWRRHEPHAGSMGQKNELLCLCVTFFWVFILWNTSKQMSAPTMMARQAEFKRVKESKRKRILIKTTINKHKVYMCRFI